MHHFGGIGVFFLRYASPMPLEHRYTGCWPDPRTLAQFPNWVFAVDEEGLPGQDETTIKPDDEQTYVTEWTDFTAADATLADGTSCVALLELADGVAWGVEIFDGEDSWRIQRNAKGGGWELGPQNAKDSSNNGELLPGDTRRFPLAVRSRLLKADDTPIEIRAPLEGTRARPWWQFWR